MLCEEIDEMTKWKWRTGKDENTYYVHINGM
jgi:hypothetical protein